MSITLTQIGAVIGFLVAFITGVKYLSTEFKKLLKSALKDEIEPIKDNITALDKKLDKTSMLSYKTDIIRYIHLIKNGTINEVELQNFYEIYDEYINSGGNSYVKEEVEKLKKQGKI